MSDGNLQILTGSQLTSTLPDQQPLQDLAGGPLTRDRVLALAESRAEGCLYGVSLPKNLKSAAFQRASTESGQQKEELDQQQAEKLFRSYFSAIADELTDDPLLVSVLDGNTIRLFLEDEDDFAMLAENLFTDLDIEDEGKLSKSEIQSALVHMGVDMGVPPLSECPVINEILKKHGAEGDDKLGQAQFAQLLQPVLQDVADALALKNVTVIQNVKITNGSKLKKLLADKNQLDDVIDTIYQQKHNGHSEQGCKGMIRNYLEKNGKELGLPPLEGNEPVILLYDAVFSDMSDGKSAVEMEKSEFGDLVKQILEKFVLNLQDNPVLHEAED